MGGFIQAGTQATIKPQTAQTNYGTLNQSVANNQQLQNFMGNQVNQTVNRQAPQASQTKLGPAQLTQGTTGTASTAGANTAANTQINPNSTQYLNALNGTNAYLTGQMNGTGPSVAQTQINQATQNQIANQLAATAAARGGSSNALAARTAANQSAAALNAANQNAAAARIQEETNAAAGLSNNLTNASGQLIGLNENAANLAQGNNQFNATLGQNNAQFNAGQNQNMTLANMANTQNANLANSNALNARMMQQGTMNQQTQMQNLAARLQAMGLNDQQIDALLNGQMGANTADINANLGQNGQAINAMSNYNAAQNAWGNSIAQGLGSGTNDLMNSTSSAASMFAMSDMNVKTGISGGNAMLGSLLDHLMQQEGTYDQTSTSSTPLIPQTQLPQTAQQSQSNSQSSGLGGLFQNMGKNSQFQSAIGNDTTDSMGGITYAMSDESTKTNLQDVGRMLDALQPYQYRYKPEHQHRAGTDNDLHVGIMAQDLQSSSLGKDLVAKGDDGFLRVAYGSPRMHEVLLAGQAYLNNRLNKLEGK